jgi:hypothetical protein
MAATVRRDIACRGRRIEQVTEGLALMGCGIGDRPLADETVPVIGPDEFGKPKAGSPSSSSGFALPTSGMQRRRCQINMISWLVRS